MSIFIGNFNNQCYWHQYLAYNVQCFFNKWLSRKIHGDQWQQLFSNLSTDNTQWGLVLFHEALNKGKGLRMKFCVTEVHHAFHLQKYPGMTRNIVTYENKISDFSFDCVLAYVTFIVFNRVGNGRLEIPAGIFVWANSFLFIYQHPGLKLKSARIETWAHIQHNLTFDVLGFSIANCFQ